MKLNKRLFLIVIDSLGIGAMPDAKAYGDEGVNTLRHISEAMDTFKIPNLQKLGMANLCPLDKVKPVESPLGYYKRLAEASVGKDTMTGHWEMMGLHIDTPFLTFTEHGFPDELIDQLSKECGHNIIGNKSASGTEILDELGEQQMKTGDMIVYTSADSVLQICGHEETFGLAELYRCCEIARKLTMKEEWRVGRVIARPYIGARKGEFKRTSNRHDYALKPFSRTILEELKDNHYDVISIGKINDIFDGEGITESNRSNSSVHGMEQTIEYVKKDFNGLCFVNLVDFDALWGHRRDPIGYGRELEAFDQKLGVFLNDMQENDLLLITADHGNDPTHTGTDHTREYVPLLAYSKAFIKSGELVDGTTFSDIGATVADFFAVENNGFGTSFLKELI